MPHLRGHWDIPQSPYMSRSLVLLFTLCVHASPTPVVLRPCVFDAATGAVAPDQFFAYNPTHSTLELQDGTGRCLTASSCSGANGDHAVLAPCSPTGACQGWTSTGPGDSPPNAFQTTLSGRCLEVNGAHNADAIDVYDCAVTQWKNQEWAHNVTSGAVTSLDTDASCCENLCLTPGPEPTPTPNLKIGAYDYFVDESSPVVYHGKLLMFESIVQHSPQWAGNWIPAFAQCMSYFRVRDMGTLAVIVNMTSSCNHAFGAATVYEDPATGAETLLISGTPWTRTGGAKGGLGWTGPCQDDNNCTVDLFWSSDPTLVDSSWSSAVPGIRVPGIGVYNNDIMAVPASAGLPYVWAMALETTGGPPRFAVSASPSPTLLSSWQLLNESYTVEGGACPSMRHDGTYFYYLTGGTDIMVLRSKDLRSWNASKRLVLEHTDPGDCIIAPHWFGAPSGYTPTGVALAHLAACGPSGNFGDDSDVDLVEWPAPFGTPGAPPMVLLQYGSGDQATFGFSNLALYNGTMNAFLQSYFV